jgi:hypothetical protein
MPDTREQALIGAIREMREATQALRTLIEKDYPTRRELESRFVQKSNQRARIWIAVIMLLTATVGSFFGTMTTVSTCFLGDPGKKHLTVCEIMPGYKEAEERNKVLLKEFVDLQKRTLSNQRRIEKLEGRP